MNIKINSEAEMRLFARDLAQNSTPSLVIYLHGDLGAGKTTLARGFIQFFGFDKVKSPTYSLVESYQNQAISIHHFDCYRLSDPEELEYIGIREYSKAGHIQLIEWADLGKGIISAADLTINISGNNGSRELSLSAQSEAGNRLLAALKPLFA